MKDRKRRSLLKAVIWRFIAVLITFVVSLIITGEIIIATQIGLLDSVLKIFGYYFHERAWEKSKFWRKE
jgi:uncharacterized membrane protein